MRINQKLHRNLQLENGRLRKRIQGLVYENKTLKKRAQNAEADWQVSEQIIDQLKAENKRLREAFGLARSMILSGENMTQQAEKIFEQALKG